MIFREGKCNIKEQKRDFPGGSVVKTPSFQMQGAQIQSLIRELKSCKPHGVARGKKGTAEMTIGTKKKLNVNTYDSMNGP